MNSLINSFVPESVKTLIRSWRERHIVPEICNLSIAQMGVDAGSVPWVKLSDGTRFYGFLPSNTQRQLYRKFQKKIAHIQEDCFAVVTDIISRYLVPRSLPGETVFRPSRYSPLRDPLNDFNLTQERKTELATIFRPKKGETYVDVGAYLGYGTMRIAQLVGSDGQVVAFESDPKVLALLKRNIKENQIDNVTIIPKAAAGSGGEGFFYQNEGTANSLRNDVLTNLGYQDLAKIKVDITTVDSVMNELSIGQADTINITVNGGEYDALQGMQKLIKNSDKIKITLAGWYYLPNKMRVADVVEPLLQEWGFNVLKGRLGRVLAWKKPHPSLPQGM